MDCDRNSVPLTEGTLLTMFYEILFFLTKFNGVVVLEQVDIKISFALCCMER